MLATLITLVLAATPACAEDMPCWDWTSMGNRQRGVVTMYGDPINVTPVEFCRLMWRHELDYLPQDYQRGDARAMEMC